MAHVLTLARVLVHFSTFRELPQPSVNELIKDYTQALNPVSPTSSLIYLFQSKLQYHQSRNRFPRISRLLSFRNKRASEKVHIPSCHIGRPMRRDNEDR